MESRQESHANDAGSFATPERLDFESLYQEFNRLRPRSPLARASPPRSPQRSSSSNIDLRELEYVSDYDPHLMCPICHVPFIDPIRLKCDHVFCYTCFMEYREQPNNTTCPSCRAHLDKSDQEWDGVPRLLVNMCDDIKVKCPYQHEGCSEVMARGHVVYHAESRCEWRRVSCPDQACEDTIPARFDNHESCRHDLIECKDCLKLMPEWEHDLHAEDQCKDLARECTECGATKPADGHLVHDDTCSKNLVDCSAKLYGCPVKASSTAMTEHEKKCFFRALMPTLQTQASKLESVQSELLREKGRNETLEGIVNRLQDLATRQLGPLLSASSASRSSNTTTSSEDTSTWVGRQMLSPTPQHSQNPAIPSLFPPSSQQHLLHLHESLSAQFRTDISTLSNSLSGLDARVSGLDSTLATVDARQSMTLMNETLRIKEELAHLNAAVYSVRSQVGWLLNQQRGRVGGPAAVGVTSTTGAALAGGTSSGGNGNGGVGVTTTRPVGRRSSSGNSSSQERVKL